MADQRLSLESRDEFLAALPKGGLCVEVGSFDGGFAERIYRIVQPSSLVLIDTWEDYWGEEGEAIYSRVQTRFDGYRNVELWRGSSSNMIARLADRSVAVAYVDAAHDYQSALADMEAMLLKMRAGGWLCGHDYCSVDGYGVVRAVAVFCDRHNLSVGMLTDEPLRQQLGSDRKYWNEWDANNSFGIQVP